MFHVVGNIFYFLAAPRSSYQKEYNEIHYALVFAIKLGNIKCPIEDIVQVAIPQEICGYFIL